MSNPHQQQPVSQSTPHSPSAGYISTQHIPANHQADPQDIPDTQSRPDRSMGIRSLLRLPRLLIRRMLYVGVKTGRVLRPHLLTIAISTVLFTIIFIQAVLLLAPRLFPATDATAATAATMVESIPPAPVVETFLQGQQTFDADLMWDTFSDSFKATLLEGDVSKEIWRAQTERERTSGVRYSDYEYAGGSTLPETGERVFFYTLNRTGPRRELNGVTAMVFFVDEDDKISRVE